MRLATERGPRWHGLKRLSWIGLNGIGFQQDGLEYGTRTNHPNADTMTACRSTM